jgi:hypothetical protein
MDINGLTLPNDFVADVAAGRFNRAKGSWPIREECDAYGNHLETELADVYDTSESIAHHTSELSIGFQPDGFYVRQEEEDNVNPGFIPDIFDFTQIVCFGTSSDAAPFCFDFRDDLTSPSVVWWDDCYWRCIAPNYKEFVDLFDMG